MWSTPAQRGCRCAVPSNRFSKLCSPPPRSRASCISPALAAEKKDFKVAWSIYVGWMPWGYAAESGIVKKWADKYGINIEVKQFNDYVESINQYTAGAFDAVTHHQHGRAVDSGRRRRRHHGRHRRRLLQRQRRGDPQGQERAQGHHRPEGQSRRVLRVALPAGARAREHQGAGKGPQGRQHVRRRHGRRLQDARRDGGGDLEADRLDHP